MEKSKQEYIEDIKEIRKIMDRSTRFLSLSGMSGITSGVIALIGAFLAYTTIYDGQDYMQYRKALLTSDSLTQLLLIAIVILVFSIGCAYFFTTRRAKKNNETLWDEHAKKMLINMAIPLVTGGILSLIFISKGFVGLAAPLTLIFYGLALVNGRKYTLDEIRSLGLMEITLGLLSAYFIGYGLIFWAVGFGGLHIIYGVVMHYKYEV
ncbi:MAG: hypothetical protein ACJA01_003243 [Saprospiraceae bacterium]|jgi:hypothetical protein